MSDEQTVRNGALQRLIDDGYEAEVRQQHLLVHSVPYVTADRTVKGGTLVCTYVENAGQVLPPDNHQVWFTGEFPCRPDGRPMRQQLDNENQRQEIFPGCWINHRFSNKPFGANGFADHYTKMAHYIAILSDQARVIDEHADARTRRVIEVRDEESVFRYANTASVRYEIVTVSARLALARIAIIGLGGTGAYVLDQVAKTPAHEIHLFDGDVFLQHNAFRAPGAATLAELKERLFKVQYHKQRYDSMRRGIEAHPYHLDAGNIAELTGFDFVFVCVDSGPARRTICTFLQAQHIPFIDVGMSVEMVPDTLKLVATCRFTTSTSAQHDHFERYVPMMADDADALYRRNIQVADLNALNAVLAVIKWKQLFGFYQDDFESHHGTLSVSSHSLTRDVMTAAAKL